MKREPQAKQRAWRSQEALCRAVADEHSRRPARAARNGAGSRGGDLTGLGSDSRSRREARSRAGSARDSRLRRTLGLIDVVAAYSALGLVIVLVDGKILDPRPAAVLIAPFVTLAAKAIGLYDRDQHVLRKTTIDEAPSLIYLAIIYALTVWLTESIVLNVWLGRPEVLTLVLLSFVLFALGRLIGRAFVSASASAERCMIVGNPTDGRRISTKLASSPGVKAVVVGCVALHPNDEPENLDGRLRGSLSGPDSLTRAIATHHIERVIIAPDSHDQDEILHIIRLIKALGVKVSVLPRLLEVVGSSSTFEDVDGLTLLGLSQYGGSKSSAFLKRVMDVALAALALVLLAPLLLLLASAVKLDSKGPVFFGQRRIGRRGEVFRMIKFRSMIPDAEAGKNGLRGCNEAEGGLFKISTDPRTTRVGRFLRTTSLDELPQLLNVLAGSMSLVGPRPLVQDEDALLEGWERRRLAVKPGMTGMWQIFGSSRIPMKEMVKIDYLYGANWSLWLDLKESCFERSHTCFDVGAYRDPSDGRCVWTCLSRRSTWCSERRVGRRVGESVTVAGELVTRSRSQTNKDTRLVVAHMRDVPLEDFAREAVGLVTKASMPAADLHTRDWAPAIAGRLRQQRPLDVGTGATVWRHPARGALGHRSPSP